jgi:membrane-associated phospholipid phosphatase
MIFRQSVKQFQSALFLVLLLFLIPNSKAQTPLATPSPTPRPSVSPTLEHEFFKNIVRDQKAIWTSPFHLNSHDVRWIAPLGVGTAALIATDRQTAGEVSELDDASNASKAVSFIGSLYSTAAIAGSFYLFGRVKHDARARETGLLAGEALINGEIVALSLKAITQRARPRAGEERGEFFEGGSSFPSGHSIQAWTVATVIAHEYSDHRSVQIAAYATAAAVSVSRFTGRNHFLSDILVGSAMGYGIGRYVYKTHHVKPSSVGTDEEESLERSRRWPSIAPVYSRSSRVYGVAGSWSF